MTSTSQSSSLPRNFSFGWFPNIVVGAILVFASCNRQPGENTDHRSDVDGDEAYPAEVKMVFDDFGKLYDGITYAQVAAIFHYVWHRDQEIGSVRAWKFTKVFKISGEFYLHLGFNDNADTGNAAELRFAQVHKGSFTDGNLRLGELINPIWKLFEGVHTFELNHPN